MLVPEMMPSGCGESVTSVLCWEEGWGAGGSLGGRRRGPGILDPPRVRKQALSINALISSY